MSQKINIQIFNWGPCVIRMKISDHFKNLLLDWAEFDIENRTKYDATMASGMTLLGSQKHIPVKKVRKPMHFAKKYNNKGLISIKV